MSSPMDAVITEPKTEQEFDDYYRLRYERLRKPLGLPPGSERDDPAESSSNHMIVKVDGRIVAAGCWAVGVSRDEATGKRTLFVRYRQMAIDPEYEGRGLGSLMTRHVAECGRALGATEVRGNARVDNVPFFERLGWVVRGPGETLYGSVESVSMAQPLQ